MPYYHKLLIRRKFEIARKDAVHRSHIAQCQRTILTVHFVQGNRILIVSAVGCHKHRTILGEFYSRCFGPLRKSFQQRRPFACARKFHPVEREPHHAVSEFVNHKQELSILGPHRMTGTVTRVCPYRHGRNRLHRIRFVEKDTVLSKVHNTDLIAVRSEKRAVRMSLILTLLIGPETFIVVNRRHKPTPVNRNSTCGR